MWRFKRWSSDYNNMQWSIYNTLCVCFKWECFHSLRMMKNNFSSLLPCENCTPVMWLYSLNRWCVSDRQRTHFREGLLFKDVRERRVYLCCWQDLSWEKGMLALLKDPPAAAPTPLLFFMEAVYPPITRPRALSRQLLKMTDMLMADVSKTNQCFKRTFTGALILL